jgi:dTDP-4-amino-4,6-dideoxygalactose transaminase
MGAIGTTSFFPSKNLGCYGDGGAMYTNDDTLAAKMNMIANHGQSRKYYHDSIGVNSRLDTLQAAILRVKLRYLDQYSEARNQVARVYDEAFAGHPMIQTPVRCSWSTHVFHQYTLKLKGADRDAFKEHMQHKGIPTMVYYPLPVHLQKAYAGYGYKAGDFPIAEALCNSVVSLPIHTEMKADDQQYMIEQTLSFFGK